VADWDERYRKGEHSPAKPHQLLVKAVASLPLGRALDIACGAGRHAIYLASLGWDVTAVDNSSVGVEIARQRASEAGVSVEMVVADLEKHSFVIEPSHYDLICDFYYLQRDLFAAMKAGLRRGGTFVGSIHILDEEPRSDSMNPAYLLNPGELQRIFTGWPIDYYNEGRWDDPEHKYRDAEIVARRP
jgi:SAM-dependent methyltransferase